ncbi:MAG: putative DNA primase/helicase [Azoarcus sp.]|nr:putative DNA primase/helicase [Azoarcus sp.]
MKNAGDLTKRVPGAEVLNADSTSPVQQPERRLPVAIYLHEEKTDPLRHGAIEWARFSASLMKHEIRREKSGRAFAPHELREGGKRRNVDVCSLSMLVADSDNGVTTNDLAARFAGLHAAIYTTHSHTHAKTKARVVVPLLHDVAVEDWPVFLAGAKERFGVDVFDEATKDPARLYYLPSCPPETAEHRRAELLTGEFLDPAPLLEVGRRERHTTNHNAVQAFGDEWKSGTAPADLAETPGNVELVKSALRAVSADCDYTLWRDLGFAVHSLGWECAFALFDGWSQLAPQRYDAGAVEKLWNSVKDGDITIATLFHHAKQNGWSDPRRARSISPDISQTLNDAGNADRFVRAVGSRVRYVVELRVWLVWHEGHWRYDRKGQIVELAKWVAKRMYTEAAELPTAADRNALTRWANASLQLSRLEAMVKLAQATLAVSVTELDADPWLLAVKNGVIELRTGAFRNSRPDDLITKIANVEFVAGATCPTWEAMLDGCMGGNQSLVDLVRRAGGYTLTGMTTEQVFFFAFGPGANGKSTVINALREIMGGHGLQSQPETIMAHRNTNPSGPTPEIARLAGVRMVAMVETEDGQRLAESRIKQMTGGDAMTARVLHGDPFDFIPKFKLWLGGNHRPVIRGDDHGIWRRIVLIPFLVTIPPEKRDKDLAEKLRAEYPGVLNWLIRGCLEWQQQGIALPPEVMREVDQYKSDMDLIAQWLDEQCTVAPNQTWGARKAYQDYATWAKDGGHQVITEVRFAQKLDERGFAKRKERQGMVYLGLTPRQRGLM